MAELIGLISSVIGIAGAGLALAQKLHEYGDGVSSSSRRAQQIAFHVRTTAQCIEEVGGVLEEEEISDRVLVSRNALETVRDVVGQCERLFGLIFTALKNAESGSGNGIGMGRLLFPFRESRVLLMMSDLERLKTTLQLLMQVVVYARVRAVQSDYQPTQRQLVEELITLRRQAMVTYGRNREEAERVEVTENESISATTVADGTAGPSVLMNVPREIPPSVKADDTIEDRHSNPREEQPPPTQESDVGMSNLTIHPAMQPPDSGPTDCDHQPEHILTATAHVPPTKNTNPETDSLRFKQQPTADPQPPNQTINPPETEETFRDFLDTFLQSLRFICCCPCLYTQRSTRRLKGAITYPYPDHLLGMGLPSYQGGIPGEYPLRSYGGAASTTEANHTSALEPFTVVPQAGLYSPSYEQGRLSRTGSKDSFPELGNADGLLHDTDDVEELLQRWTNLYETGPDEGVKGLDG
ncbi:hypothetical protein BO78DRAFT_427268 [Aspergillus sclerotiicarbonarius CBS 121057]|uniref:Fungal N-terminal domain-containing protein n=1 Tax=Aspergillus sclerotiicarbonarius (strain CBS 121057 / IBT 28362) TaxID=1448318 RepID=A0A319FLL7_ASPSB|nr:hypothetical protein BO78DRAFT_427268 [Aspergillus sclerotiicarbonarius CBS 121057]